MKTIEEAAERYADERAESIPQDEWFDHHDLVKAFADGADFALANQWVSVEERLPKHGVLVLAMDVDGDAHAARYNEIAECWQEEGRRFEWHGEGITRWMPIPEPNTEER